MDLTILEVAAVAFGLLIRLGIPIALTALLALFLKWLDKRWQAEAEAEAVESAALAALPMAERPPCWEVHNCPSSLRSKCAAYGQTDQPCWEVFQTNGRLKPSCRNCKVPPPEIIERAVFA